MLHAVSPNVPPTKGSILLYTQGYEECKQIRETIVRTWSSDKYRVTANCISVKQ
jgi:hypothetical protein